MFENITVVGGSLSEKEIGAYISHVKRANPSSELDWMTIEVDGEFANLSYQMKPQKFDRIRRVTGYLVGTLDRWNDAKSAEERDRTKHA